MRQPNNFHEVLELVPDHKRATNLDQRPKALMLKKLVLRGTMAGVEDSILFPLLQLCPGLEAFTPPLIMHDRLDDMASVLREHCPRLKDLSLTFLNLNDNQAVRLLDNEIKGTLERISISTCRNHLTDRRVLEISEMGTQRALLDHAATLEMLQLTDCGFDITSK